MSGKRKAGDSFGSWTLVGDSQLGQGGNCHVWEAVNPSNEHGAIKFLQQHHLEQIQKPHGAKKVERFLREIRFYREHRGLPGILPRLDDNLPESPSPQDPPWIVLARATPLSDAFLPNERELGAIVRLIAKVAETLSSLHTMEIYHRDIKPENLFRLGGEAVIGDFGLVELPALDSLTETGEILGSRFYVAHEMVSAGKDSKAGPADVYSLAKTLWVLATGQRYPLPGEQRRDVPALRLSSYVRNPRAILLDSLIEAATNTEPSRRPTMEAFAKNLTEWLREVSPVTPGDLGHLREQMQATLEPSHRTVQKEGEHQALAERILKLLSPHVDALAATISRELGSSWEIECSDVVVCFMCFHSAGFNRMLDWGPKLGYCMTRVSAGNRAQDADKTHDVSYWGGVGLRVADSGEIYLCAAHLIGLGSDHPDQIWSDDAICLPESAALENTIQRLGNGLSESLEAALKKFMERVHRYQHAKLR